MQDLNTINTKNVEAFNDAVQAARNNGQHVVLEKQGLHVVGFKTFTSAEQATTYAANYTAGNVSGTGEVLGAL